MSPVLFWLMLTLTSAQSVQRDFSESVDNIENLVQYEYQYSVDEGHAAGPVMGRWEKRLGDYVKGTYTFLGPDNMIRTVDYEVDGPSGYKAIQRLNPFVPGLLSSQQLNKSNKLFPHSLSNPSTSAPTPKKPQSESEKLHNYHAYSPYWNLKGSILDQKTAASTNFDPSRQPVPKSPSNYNTDIPRNVIHFQKPAGKILGPKKATQLNTKYSKKQLEPIKFSNTITQAFAIPLKRDSKLVKRFKSFDEVIQLK